MNHQINPKNISQFLHFFAKKVNKNFDDATIKRWQGLSDENLQKNLDKLLEHFGYDDQVSKDRLVTEFRYTQTEPQSAHTAVRKPVSRNVQTPPPPPPRRKDKNAALGEVTPSPTPAKSRNGWMRILFVVFIISIVAGAAYLWSKYTEYSGRSQVYCLANNLSVRKDLLSEDKWETRMDLFGSYRDITGHVHSTTQSLPLVDEEMYDEYYKVYMDTSFTQYLLDGENSIGYVHSKYVTTRSSEYNRYQEVFQHYADDYNEMAYLPMDLRRVIVNAVYNYPELKGKILSPPCFKAPKNDEKNPRSIGGIKIKSGNAVSHIVVSRIGGVYYTIHSNQDATELYIDKTNLRNGSSRELITEAGKFSSIAGSGSIPGLSWTNCDQSIEAICRRKPFTEFVVKGTDVPTPIAPPTTNTTRAVPDSNSLEDQFIQDANFIE